MSTIKDGGPAFPVNELNHQTGDVCAQNFGMSLRDHYAGLAMQGFLAGHISHHGHQSHWPYDQMASEAFDVADAMLKAREGGAA